MNIEKIIIFTRGKNRDEYGNPYQAFKAYIKFAHKSYFTNAIVTQSMQYTNNSSKSGCLNDALYGINEFLTAIKHPKKTVVERIIKPDDKRITQIHKHVHTFQELENPENWKCELP